MKPSDFERKKIVRDIFLVISLLTGFVFIVAFSVYYVSDAINQGDVCGCVIPIPLMLLLLSSLGVFVGSLSYYFLASRFSRKEREHSQEVHQTLRFLEREDRKIVQILIKAKKEVPQYELVKESELDKVKVSRLLHKLEIMGVIKKEDKGRVNYISLHENIQKIFT